MKKPRLLIIDSDIAYTEYISKRFAETNCFDVVGSASDGTLGLSLIHSVKADIILLDPMLPGMDGLSLLKAIKLIKQPPMTVCISSFYTSVSIELTRRSGADYYVYKPIDPDALANVLAECATMVDEQRRQAQSGTEMTQSNELSMRIHRLMHDLGFSSKHSGSCYIAEAILIALEFPMAMHNLSSDLYCRIAERMHVSTACIERSMRTAITFANLNGRLETMIGETPTNKTCIRYILRQIKAQQ